MSNLLPREVQRRAWGNARSRMILVSSLLIASSLFAAIFALAPSGLAIYIARAHVQDRFGSRGADVSATSTAPLSQAQAIIAQIAAFPATTSPEAVRAALMARPNGVAVDAISYTVGMPSTIILSGVARTPDRLDAYKSALAANQRFSSVSLPLGALLGSQDGHFTVTLSGNF